MSTPVGFSVKTAWLFSCKHKEAIEKSEVCSCYYCLHKFPPSAINEWVEDEGTLCTAVCPKCDIDAVLPFDVATDILQECQSKWFGEVVGLLVDKADYENIEQSGIYPVFKG